MYAQSKRQQNFALEAFIGAIGREFPRYELRNCSSVKVRRQQVFFAILDTDLADLIPHR
jgi:hypothetical protein